MNNANKRHIKDYLFTPFILLAITYLFTYVIGYPISFDNDYMNINGIHPVHILVSRVQYYKINRGDILVYDRKILKQSVKVRRLIGLPNEKIDIKNINGNGVIFINNKELNEPYTNSIPYENYNCKEQKCLDIALPEDSYLLLPDTRKKSIDINSSIINKKRVSGKAIFLIAKNSFKIQKINRIKY